MATRPGETAVHIDPGVLGRTLLETAHAARIGVTVTLLDGPAPRNAYVSDVAAELLGWPVQDLIDHDLLAHVAPADVEDVRARFAERMARDLGQTSYELRVQRQDGSEGLLEITASHTLVEGRRAVVSLLVDLSPRREAETQKRANEARFRELIEGAPEPIGIIRQGRFVYVNPAYVTVLGYPDAEALYAVSLADILDREQAAVRDQREATVLKSRAPLAPQLYAARRFDGSSVMLEVVSVYFEYQGQPSALGMARDVTARKRLEQQLVQSDRLAALGTMAAGVAHEVNNPLAYLMLNLEWIARKLPAAGSDPSSMQGLMAMLAEARQGAERVSSIVRELRSFSRADGETRGCVDLAEVVQSAIKIAGHEIRHKARIITTFESARPVWANEARMEQVVINLLLNAAQAMSESAADAHEIRVTVRADGDTRAVLEVFDNGDGIPAEVLPRIFDPFFTTKAVGGTGLGLSICHGIVTSLGGQIAAYSEPGEGTTFRVVLPTTDTVVGASQPPPSLEAPSSRAGRSARVLVVDDEAPIAHTLRELLAPEHEVVAATSAKEALAALAQGDFDVIFCDLIMPGAGGIDLYERLRAQRPGMERRIVFMTGGAFTARTAEFLATVDNRRVEKPFSFGLVEQLVREAAARGARA